jgi:hypothetical protein
VFAAVTDVENVILSVTAVGAEEYHHMKYQYVVWSDIQANKFLATDKSESVLSATAQVEYVILSAVTIAAHVVHHATYQ